MAEIVSEGFYVASDGQREMQYKLTSLTGYQWISAEFIQKKLTTPWKKKRTKVLCEQYLATKGKSGSSEDRIFPDDIISMCEEKKEEMEVEEDNKQGDILKPFKGASGRPSNTVLFDISPIACKRLAQELGKEVARQMAKVLLVFREIDQQERVEDEDGDAEPRPTEDAVENEEEYDAVEERPAKKLKSNK